MKTHERMNVWHRTTTIRHMRWDPMAPKAKRTVESKSQRWLPLSFFLVSFTLREKKRFRLYEYKIRSYWQNLPFFALLSCFFIVILVNMHEHLVLGLIGLVDRDLVLSVENRPPENRLSANEKIIVDHLFDLGGKYQKIDSFISKCRVIRFEDPAAEETAENGDVVYSM